MEFITVFVFINLLLELLMVSGISGNVMLIKNTHDLECLTNIENGPIEWVSNNIDLKENAVTPSSYEKESYNLDNTDSKTYFNVYPSINSKWESWLNSIENYKEIFDKPFKNFSGNFSVKYNQPVTLQIMTDRDEPIYDVKIDHSEKSGSGKTFCNLKPRGTDRWIHFNVLIKAKTIKIRSSVGNCFEKIPYVRQIKFKHFNNAVWKMKQTNDLFVKKLDFEVQSTKKCFNVEVIGRNLSLNFIINKTLKSPTYVFQELERRTIYYCIEKGTIQNIYSNVTSLSPDFIFGVKDEIELYNPGYRVLPYVIQDRKYLRNIYCHDLETNERARIDSMTIQQPEYSNECNIEEKYYDGQDLSICCNNRCYHHFNSISTKWIHYKIEQNRTFFVTFIGVIFSVIFGCILVCMYTRRKDEDESSSYLCKFGKKLYEVVPKK